MVRAPPTCSDTSSRHHATYATAHRRNRVSILAAIIQPSVDEPKLPTTDAYAALLTRLDGLAYEAAVTALWALERVYLDGWTTALSSSSSPYAAFAAHWTAPAFRAYVATLATLAAPDSHADLIAEVLAHEVAFWDMALS